MFTELAAPELEESEGETGVTGATTEMPGDCTPPSRRAPRAVPGLGVGLADTPVGSRDNGDAKAAESSEAMPLSLYTADALGRVKVAEYSLESSSGESRSRCRICAVEQSELLRNEDTLLDDIM